MWQVYDIGISVSVKPWYSFWMLVSFFCHIGSGASQSICHWTWKCDELNHIYSVKFELGDCRIHHYEISRVQWSYQQFRLSWDHMSVECVWIISNWQCNGIWLMSCKHLSYFDLSCVFLVKLQLNKVVPFHIRWFLYCTNELRYCKDT